MFFSRPYCILNDSIVLNDLDRFAQVFAWAQMDLRDSVLQTLIRLEDAGEEIHMFGQLRHSLHVLLGNRTPGEFPEGRALKILMDLQDNTGNFKELERRLRVVIIQRAQSKLYSHLLQYWENDWEKRRQFFLKYCWQQMGEPFHNGDSVFLLGYHKQYGSDVESCFLLQRNLFPSMSEHLSTRGGTT